MIPIQHAPTLAAAVTRTDHRVQQLARDLQAALGVSIVSGSITLNFNEGIVASLKTETYLRLQNAG